MGAPDMNAVDLQALQSHPALQGSDPALVQAAMANAVTGAAPSAAPAIPGVTPDMLDKTVQRNTGTTTRGVLTPAIKTNLTQQKLTGLQSEDQARAEGEFKAGNAQVEADAAAHAAELAAQKQAAIDAAIADGNEQVAVAQKRYADKVQSYDGMKLQDFFRGDREGNRAAASVLVALGSLGAGLRGSNQNDALDILKGNVNHDFAIQQANIEKAKDSIVMARTGIQDAQAAKASLLADVGAKHAAAWGAVEAELRKGLAARGMEGAQIDADSRVIAAKKERLQAEQQALAPTIAHVTSTVERTKTESDPRLAGARAKAAKDALTWTDPDTGEALPVGAKTTRDYTINQANLQVIANARKAVQNLAEFYQANPGRQVGVAGFGTEGYKDLHRLRELTTQAMAKLQGIGSTDAKFSSDMRTLPPAGDLLALSQDPSHGLAALNKAIDDRKTTVLRATGNEPSGRTARPSIETPSGPSGTVPGARAQAAPAVDKLQLARQAITDPEATAAEKQQAKKLIMAAQAH
jgi:hypothetical protein